METRGLKSLQLVFQLVEHLLLLRLLLVPILQLLVQLVAPTTRIQIQWGENSKGGIKVDMLIFVEENVLKKMIVEKLWLLDRRCIIYNCSKSCEWMASTGHWSMIHTLPRRLLLTLYFFFGISAFTCITVFLCITAFSIVLLNVAWKPSDHS